jgi:RNA polymerase sigma-70 factor (ECF subfamily)
LDEFQRELVALLPRLRRFARSLTGNATDADDLVQTAVERALARRSQWRADTHLHSWMFTLMKHLWIDDRRAHGRRATLAHPADEGERVADPAAPNAQTRTVIERAMDALPSEQRVAVALVLVEGLSYAEASRVLGIPEGTLTSRLARGRTALMASLQGMGA